MQNEIEQMSKVLKGMDRLDEARFGFYESYARAIYNAGYRKIYDDHQRQGTCYALGCQMAEELKKEVAMEIFEEIESCIWSETHYGDSKLCFEINSEKYAELKKKYTEDKGAI